MTDLAQPADEALVALGDELRRGPWWDSLGRLEQEARDREAAAVTPVSSTSTADDVTPLSLPLVPALMENNLSRKGVWSLTPSREQMEFTYQTDDLIGSLTINYTLGQLSGFEMELTAWVLGRWDRESPSITFSLRECADAFGVSWGGSRGDFIKNALQRIAGTRITGRVWDVRTRKHTLTNFGIIDTVRIVDHRDSFDGAPTGPGTVTIVLSTFLAEQLAQGQFVRLDWQIFRGRLSTPFARRLYLLVESQQGWEKGTFYQVGIDSRLGETLGTTDAKTNMSRFRSRIQKAGEEIVTADPRYVLFRIRHGRKRGDYVLEVRRKAA